MDEEPCASDSATASEESDQENENSMDEATYEEDDEQPLAQTTASAGQTPEPTPANIPSGSNNSTSYRSLMACSLYKKFQLVPEANDLVSINQTHFTMDAIPSRRGRPRRTRDMVEVFVCICGLRVEKQERIMGSKTALRCAYEGCETSWVRFLLILS